MHDYKRLREALMLEEREVTQSKLRLRLRLCEAGMGGVSPEAQWLQMSDAVPEGTTIFKEGKQMGGWTEVSQ